MRLVVVPTGTANIASLTAGFRRLGAEPALAGSAEDVATADHVVLPGVGAFGAAIDAVDRAGYRDVLRGRIADGVSTLAVCVGMQLLSGKSEESEGVAGLGLVGEPVTRFPEVVRAPQFGWNEVSAQPGCRFVSDGWAYFANSFRLVSVPQGWVGATTDHGGSFVSAMERGDVLACQFHPELSGPWGSEVLERWLEGG
ncbi:MAG: imidazole glycerol phosphate synthase subunit HisH [Acidimicrobiia bacterium]